MDKTVDKWIATIYGMGMSKQRSIHVKISETMSELLDKARELSGRSIQHIGAAGVRKEIAYTIRLYEKRKKEDGE